MCMPVRARARYIACIMHTPCMPASSNIQSRKASASITASPLGPGSVRSYVDCTVHGMVHGKSALRRALRSSKAMLARRGTYLLPLLFKRDARLRG